MPAIPAAGYISDDARIEGEYKTALEDLVASVRHAPWSGQVEVPVTIVGGSITPPGSAGVVVVDTEAGTSTDDLTNIVTTYYPDGAFLLVRNANAGRVVVVKHAISGIGTVQLDRGADYALDDTKKWLLIRRHGTDWYELKRGPDRLQSETSVKTATFTVQKQDIGKIFICTGSYTINLAAASGCGNGHMFGIRNVGTGTLVIDANGSELIDGATVLSIPPGWSMQLLCTGTSWITLDSTGPQPTKNPIMNGQMDVWQRGAALSLTLSSGSFAYVADRWNGFVQGASKSMTINRSTNVPTVAQAGVLFNYSLEVDVTTAYGSLASGDAVLLRQNVTGGAWRHVHQRQTTLSFWVMSTKTGVHSVSLTNAVGTRCFVGTYTVNVANTWEYKAITIPAAPSTILANQPTVTAIYLGWVLAAGTTYRTSSLNSWLTTTAPGVYASTSQVNCLDSTSNFFRITGVKLEVGSVATPYDVTSFGEEYLDCLRHYQKSSPYGTAMASNLGSDTGEYIFTCPVGPSTLFNSIYIPYRVPMLQGTATFLLNPNAANSQVRNRNTNTDCTGSTVINPTPRGFAVQATTPGGSAQSHTMAVHWHSQA